MRTLLLLALTLSLTACVSTRARHGYVIERGEDSLQAEVGIDTRESVLARYGEPSVRPAMSNDVWYYVSSATNSRAFYETQTTQRQVVAFNFDDEGRVASIDNYTLADGRDVNIVGRETPTRGKELSFLEQLIGGVGQMPGIPQGADPGGTGAPDR
ncbi:outer membrane protein assembly factor BamE [Parvularcula dongshanensis]|uniref:Outer membrane protein assembly factor BamE (Lipoprotein component of BamABCDE complex) n=1 Tax=Parvularcula dongshanensis TaxID=1173995 RepID=A0A840I5X7_9PROT|nr:outer membrane protein assembly factor BamE [Parvularcula dongshanensis]MBB4659671.1 outer membrane protein assembly factor BamE (lipoprotein component of BamABCDE complex) [Parvularcula dongshanensis]